MHFAAEENAQIVPFAVVCTGNPRVKETLLKVEVVVHNGHSHYHFNSNGSCKVQTMGQQTTLMKKARKSVFVDIDLLSKEEDSNGDNDNDKEMEQVGSRTKYNNGP
jgi:hypothetical protein